MSQITQAGGGAWTGMSRIYRFVSSIDTLSHQLCRPGSITKICHGPLSLGTLMHGWQANSPPLRARRGLTSAPGFASLWLAGRHRGHPPSDGPWLSGGRLGLRRWHRVAFQASHPPVRGALSVPNFSVGRARGLRSFPVTIFPDVGCLIISSARGTVTFSLVKCA